MNLMRMILRLKQSLSIDQRRRCDLTYGSSLISVKQGL